MKLNHIEEYNKWLNDPYIDETTKQELLKIKDDENEILDRFYQGLPFGTAGMRGIIGAGLNRMNSYVVEITTQALAEVLIEEGEENKEKGVAIAYDCRHFSKEFAWLSASILAGNGIRTYIYDGMRPTPELSFTVRHLKCASGIMITASHNPKNYNGYKLYNSEGSQILSDTAEKIAYKKEHMNGFASVKKMNTETAIEKGLIKVLGEETDRVYIDLVKGLTLIDPAIPKDINIVYTPLNGTGSKLMRQVLAESGFTNVYIVKEQQDEDPDFTTVEYPNPEDPKAFDYALRYGKKHDADLLLATDPDADRLAVMVKMKNGEYQFLTGNQTAALLISYILASRKERGILPANGAMIKSIVTGELGDEIAESYGVATFETLTGFKNIFAKANEFERTGKYEFLLGYEESIGYNARTFVRDKDAISSGMLICEACAYYKSKGLTLYDALEELQKRFGYFGEKLMNIVLEGYEGQRIINATMEKWRTSYPAEMNGSKLVYKVDYKTGIKETIADGKTEKVDVDYSDVLKYKFDNGCWYAIRPSGTEPKLKVYLYSKGTSKQNAQDNIEALERIITQELIEAGAIRKER
jgi:phosphoglucomutase